MQPTSLSAASTPFAHADGAGNMTGSTDPHLRSCSCRVRQALAEYNSVLEEVSESMSDSEPTNSTPRLRHGMARATAALAIEQMVACTPNSFADLSVKHAVLDDSRAFCADNSWLEPLINKSISRDLAHVSKRRRGSPSWFPRVPIPSWPARPWTKARAAPEEA